MYWRAHYVSMETLLTLEIKSSSRSDAVSLKKASCDDRLQAFARLGATDVYLEIVFRWPILAVNLPSSYELIESRAVAFSINRLGQEYFEVELEVCGEQASGLVEDIKYQDAALDTVDWTPFFYILGTPDMRDVQACGESCVIGCHTSRKEQFSFRSS